MAAVLGNVTQSTKFQFKNLGILCQDILDPLEDFPITVLLEINRYLQLGWLDDHQILLFEDPIADPSTDNGSSRDFKQGDHWFRLLGHDQLVDSPLVLPIHSEERRDIPFAELNPILVGNAEILDEET